MATYAAGCLFFDKYDFKRKSLFINTEGLNNFKTAFGEMKITFTFCKELAIRSWEENSLSKIPFVRTHVHITKLRLT